MFGDFYQTFRDRHIYRWRLGLVLTRVDTKGSEAQSFMASVRHSSGWDTDAGIMVQVGVISLIAWGLSGTGPPWDGGSHGGHGILQLGMVPLSHDPSISHQLIKHSLRVETPPTRRHRGNSPLNILQSLKLRTRHTWHLNIRQTNINLHFCGKYEKKDT